MNLGVNGKYRFRRQCINWFQPIAILGILYVKSNLPRKRNRACKVGTPLAGAFLGKLSQFLRISETRAPRSLRYLVSTRRIRVCRIGSNERKLKS